MQDELEERVAQAAYIAHHKTGPWEDALDEPNMGRGGYKTEVARWHSIARAIIPIVAKWRRERDAGIALSKYDPRNRNGAREWDEWVWAAGQIAAAIRGAE